MPKSRWHPHVGQRQGTSDLDPSVDCELLGLVWLHFEFLGWLIVVRSRSCVSPVADRHRTIAASVVLQTTKHARAAQCTFGAEDRNPFHIFRVLVICVIAGTKRPGTSLAASVYTDFPYEAASLAFLPFRRVAALALT